MKRSLIFTMPIKLAGGTTLGNTEKQALQDRTVQKAQWLLVE